MKAWRQAACSRNQSWVARGGEESRYVGPKICGRHQMEPVAFWDKTVRSKGIYSSVCACLRLSDFLSDCVLLCGELSEPKIFRGHDPWPLTSRADLSFIPRPKDSTDIFCDHGYPSTMIGSLESIGTCRESGYRNNGDEHTSPSSRTTSPNCRRVEPIDPLLIDKIIPPQSQCWQAFQT